MIKKNAKSTFPTACVKCGKLIAALMASDIALMSVIEQRLTAKFGAIERGSDLFPFLYTDYYTPEMGASLQKKFISFVEMIDIARLPEIKNFTNTVEEEYAIENKRRINIDPGYVTHAQMVLATTKDYSHRIYLGQGIYAELTYLCRQKAFHLLEWTYPDYREPFALAFFRKVRETYLQQTREKNRVVLAGRSAKS